MLRPSAPASLLLLLLLCTCAPALLTAQEVTMEYYPPPSENTYPFNRGLVPFQENGRHGYRRPDGSVVVPARYQEAFSWQPDGYAVVRGSTLRNNGWGLIDTSGRVVIAPRFTKISPLSPTHYAAFTADSALVYAVPSARLTAAFPLAHGEADPYAPRLATRIEHPPGEYAYYYDTLGRPTVNFQSAIMTVDLNEVDKIPAGIRVLGRYAGREVRSGNLEDYERRTGSLPAQAVYDGVEFYLIEHQDRVYVTRTPSSVGWQNQRYPGYFIKGETADTWEFRPENRAGFYSATDKFWLAPELLTGELTTANGELTMNLRRPVIHVPSGDTIPLRIHLRGTAVRYPEDREPLRHFNGSRLPLVHYRSGQPGAYGVEDATGRELVPREHRSVITARLGGQPVFMAEQRNRKPAVFSLAEVPFPLDRLETEPIVTPDGKTLRTRQLTIGRHNRRALVDKKGRLLTDLETGFNRIMWPSPGVKLRGKHPAYLQSLDSVRLVDLKNGRVFNVTGGSLREPLVGRPTYRPVHIFSSQTFGIVDEHLNVIIPPIYPNLYEVPFTDTSFLVAGPGMRTDSSELLTLDGRPTGLRVKASSISVVGGKVLRVCQFQRCRYYDRQLDTLAIPAYSSTSFGTDTYHSNPDLPNATYLVGSHADGNDLVGLDGERIFTDALRVLAVNSRYLVVRSTKDDRGRVYDFKRRTFLPGEYRAVAPRPYLIYHWKKVVAGLSFLPRENKENTQAWIGAFLLDATGTISVITRAGGVQPLAAFIGGELPDEEELSLLRDRIIGQNFLD